MFVLKGNYSRERKMVSMSSTLVETVSINYEDFNESFLTCGTCLCMYDGGEHTPKLLACSHTVCLHCLSRIAGQNPAAPTFRCPICRDNITVPRGGVAALPPSFLVNQLLDLMASQRREVVPKCSAHFNQELLFCETCDTVFCSQCTSGSHSSSSSSAGGGTSAEHTVIPFSIAIKRMSEILLYKVNECISKLSKAEEAVQSEVERLEGAVRTCLERVETFFSEAHAAVEARRQAVVDQINLVRDAKLKVLRAQLDTIQAEKDKVKSECDGLQYQVEVRNISQRISSLSEKLESVTVLSEPRENSFIECSLEQGCLANLERVLMATVRTTTTFPSLSTLSSLGEHVVNLEGVVVLTTVDYDGNVRLCGGDPIIAELTSPNNEQISVEVEDRGDGTYHLKFRPPIPGSYEMKVTIVDRPVKQTPFGIVVSEHNNPIATYGSRGSGKDQLLQPVAVTFNPLTQYVYVVDTGNSRIKVLTKDLSLVKHVENPGLHGRSCTGIASYSSAASDPWLVVVNWRTQAVTRMSIDGDTVASFTHCGFQEPIDIAVDSTYGHILVADNGPSCVFVFDTEGKFLFEVGKKGSTKGCFNLISGVTVGPEGEIVVADSRIQVFSAKGDFLQEIYPQGKGKGRYGGITVDAQGHILGSRTEKGKNFIQVFSLSDGNLLGTIDSDSSKLKRPSGVADIDGKYVIVVDLGNDTLKKYCYW